MRVANKDAKVCVDNCISFKGNNLFAEWKNDYVYVVYSYGYHFPIYAKIKNVWYGNENTYSVTTSKHKSQARPSGKIEYFDTEKLQDKIRNSLGLGVGV